MGSKMGRLEGKMVWKKVELGGSWSVYAPFRNASWGPNAIYKQRSHAHRSSFSTISEKKNKLPSKGRERSVATVVDCHQTRKLIPDRPAGARAERDRDAERGGLNEYVGS